MNISGLSNIPTGNRTGKQRRGVRRKERCKVIDEDYLSSRLLPQILVLPLSLFVFFFCHISFSFTHNNFSNNRLYDPLSSSLLRLSVINFLHLQVTKEGSSVYHLTSTTSLISKLDNIPRWGIGISTRHTVSENQFPPNSSSKDPLNLMMSFGESFVRPLNSINILGIILTSSLSWKPHITVIVKCASEKERERERERRKGRHAVQGYNAYLLRADNCQLCRQLTRPQVENYLHTLWESSSTFLLNGVT